LNYQKIAFAKAKSDSVAKKDGTFVPRPKRIREETTQKQSDDSKQQPSTGPPPAKVQKLMVNNIPHRILFAQNLPDECTHETLTTLFQPYPGFQEVRMVPGKKEIAFIEFHEVIQAGIALQQLNGFKLNGTDTLNLTYGNQ
jgi:RNA recognition motif-containing protein